jgi:hypothetical protein
LNFGPTIADLHFSSSWLVQASAWARKMLGRIYVVGSASPENGVVGAR